MEELTYNGICFERIFDCKERFFKSDEDLSQLYANFALYLKNQGLSYDVIYKILQIKVGLVKPDEMHGNQFIKQLIDDNETMPCYEFYNRFDSNNLFCRVCPSCPIDACQFYDLEVDILTVCLKKPNYVDIVQEELKKGALFNSVVTDELFKKSPDKMMPAFAIPITRLYFENMILEKNSLDEFVEMIGDNFGSPVMVKDLVIKFVTKIQFESGQSVKLSSKKKLTDACKKIHSVFGPTSMFPPVGFVGKQKRADKNDDNILEFLSDQENGNDIDSVTKLDATQKNKDNSITKNKESSAQTENNDDVETDYEALYESVSLNDMLMNPSIINDVARKEKHQDTVKEKKLSTDEKNEQVTDDENSNVIDTPAEENVIVIQENIEDENENTADNVPEKNASDKTKFKNSLFVLRKKISLLEGSDIIDIEENPSLMSNYENGLINDGYMVCDIFSDDDGRNYIVSYVNKYKQFFKFSTDFERGMNVLSDYMRSQSFKIYVSNPYVLCYEFYTKTNVIPAAIYSVYRLYTSLYERKKYMLSDAILNIVSPKKYNGNIDLFYLSNYRTICREYVLKCKESDILDEVMCKMNADILYGTSLSFKENDVSYNLISFTPNGNLNYMDTDFEIVYGDNCGLYAYIDFDIDLQQSEGFDKTIRYVYEHVLGLYVGEGRLKKCCPKLKRLKSSSVILEFNNKNEYEFFYDLIVYYSRKAAALFDCYLDLTMGIME